MLDAHTLSVNINCPSARVYEFAVNPENLPQWAGGLCQSVTHTASGWVIHTAQGDMPIRFAERNDWGVLDHQVEVAPGVTVKVPMRVLPNQSGSTLLFTLLRQPGMSDADFARDAQLVEQDLQRLKQLLEQ